MTLYYFCSLLWKVGIRPRVWWLILPWAGMLEAWQVGCWDVHGVRWTTMSACKETQLVYVGNHYQLWRGAILWFCCYVIVYTHVWTHRSCIERDTNRILLIVCPITCSWKSLWSMVPGCLDSWHFLAFLTIIIRWKSTGAWEPPVPCRFLLRI